MEPKYRAAWAFIGNVQAHFGSSIRSDTVGEITKGGKSRLYFALWLSKEGQGSCFCSNWCHDASRFSRIGAAFSQSGEFANSVLTHFGTGCYICSNERRG